MNTTLGQPELDQMIQCYFDDSLDAGGIEQLNHHLRHDEQARQQLARCFLICSILADQASVNAKSAKRRAMIEPEPVSRRRWVIPVSAGLAIAACLLLVGLVYLFDAPPVETKTQRVAIQPVATLVQTDGVHWLSEPRIAGDSLNPQAISLSEGTAELVHVSGATVRLTGPCEYELTGDNSGVLHRGRLHSRITSKASGFTVQMGQAMRAVDLGTEFVAWCDNEQGAGVDVIEGSVRVDLLQDKDDPLQAVELKAGRTARLVEGRLSLGRLAEPAVDWSMDRPEQTPRSSAHQHLTVQPVGEISSGPGVFDHGLVFTGGSDAIELNTSKLIPETGPFGIFVWVRTSHHASDDDLAYLVHNYVSNHDGRFALCIFEGQLSYFLETTSVDSGVTIADGQWHHVGLTRDDDGRMHFWVDGEPTEAGTNIEAIGGQGDPWRLGARASDEQRSFVGTMDHLAVFHRRPLDHEIQWLARRPISQTDSERDSHNP